MTLTGCGGGSATIATSATSIASSTIAPIGVATLSWVPPNQNTDGSLLYYGLGPDALTEVVDVPTVGITDYVIDYLTAGTYYFSIRVYTTAGLESALSNVVCDGIG